MLGEAHAGFCLRILYAFGEEEQVQFNTGKTYLAVVDLEEAEGFTFEPDESEVASSASGQMRAAPFRKARLRNNFVCMRTHSEETA